MPLERRLFDGQWFECAIELETASVRRRPRPGHLDEGITPLGERYAGGPEPAFRGKDKWEQAAESVKDMCGHISLPRPREDSAAPGFLGRGALPMRESIPIDTKERRPGDGATVTR